jgi:lipid-binding SYLF domain-containing protein
MRSITLLMMVGLALALAGCAQEQEMEGMEPVGETGEIGMGEEMEERADYLQDARELAQEAATTLQEMQADEDLGQALQRSAGVLLCPDYGKGAAIVGGRGGECVLMARQQGSWTGPAFYDIGAISLGAQIGGAAGDVAILLMSQDGVDSFMQDNTFSLNADAGFTLIDWAARGQEQIGKGNEVVFWSDMEGAFAGISLSATAISWDDEENPAWYGQQVSPNQVLQGSVQSQEMNPLEGALPAAS